MSKINGRFYFKLTDAGNLIGEYSNNTPSNIRTESASRNVPSDPKEFAGNYTSSWYEPGNSKCIAASLSIVPKPNYPRQYILEWCKLDTLRKIFLGEAMLCDGILIGNYWSV